ncbi:MAG: PilZ domain-containing protein [Proteobacteria bacterium]|nr:PilZ domain-containing protein [Pseudomonadota bacterium]
MEHRWGQRDDVSIPVRLRWRQRYGASTGEITNISASGAWIQTNAQLPLLTPLEVDMLAAGGRGGIAAYVVRTDSGGYGIEWRSPSEQRLQVPAGGVDNPRVLTR